MEALGGARAAFDGALCIVHNQRRPSRRARQQSAATNSFPCRLAVSGRVPPRSANRSRQHRRRRLQQHAVDDQWRTGSKRGAVSEGEGEGDRRAPPAEVTTGRVITRGRRNRSPDEVPAEAAAASAGQRDNHLHLQREEPLKAVLRRLFPVLIWRHPLITRGHRGPDLRLTEKDASPQFPCTRR